MDEERRLLIAMVEAHADARSAMAAHGTDSRESFMASAAFEWTVIEATKYVESIRVKRARPMPPSNTH